jgi:DNA-binding MarR family transcriptional regulator
MAHARSSERRENAADAVVESLFQSLRTLKSAATPGNTVDGACSAVLHYIRTNGPIRPTDLAAQMLLDGSTVSRHVQQLERLDLVDRERDPEDRRAFRIACTAHGVSAAEGALAARRALLLAAVQEWPAADLEQLERLLGRLADDLSSVSHHTRTPARETTSAGAREEAP